MKKLILHDLARLWLLVTACLVGGLVLNEMRARPLGLAYASPQARMDQLVARTESSAAGVPALDGDVSRDEMEKLIENRAAIILDARSEVFYRIGHIPSAVSLPRDDFDAQYPKLKAILQSGRPIVVYCSGSECHDSRMVADALRAFGFTHVRLFRGGWYDWASANLPQEKAP